MSNRLEDKIRDYLAGNLEVLEKGLILLGKECKVPTSVGAGGRIDILAQDIFGHKVVIEIKRSEQTARQALHEIHKYIALFRNTQGLDESRIRLIVVSTEWHELRLPLSEFAETTSYPVDAISIVVEPDGVIRQISKVELLKRAGAIKISRTQCIYGYRTAAARQENLDILLEAVKSAGIQDFAVLRCNHNGNDARIIYPYAHYLCFSSPLLNMSVQEIQELKSNIEWEEDLLEPDSNFLCHINKHNLCDSLEIGYPEKLVGMRADWSVSVAVCSGRLDRAQSILTDEEIITATQQIEGGSSIYLARLSSPRFEASWRQLRSDLEVVLQDNSTWQQTVSRLLDEIGAVTPRATVSASIYHPNNIFLTLYFIAWNQDYSKCPHFEIVIEDKEQRVVRALLGILVWDGQEIVTSPDDLIQNIFEDDFSWTLALSTGATASEQDMSLELHHLKQCVVEWCFKGDETIGPTEVFIANEKISRRSFNEGSYRPMIEFADVNASYLAVLKDYVASRVGGLPGTVGSKEMYR